MIKRLLLLYMLFASLSAFAQASTRPVVLTWTPPSTAGFTGYEVYRCTVPTGATSCTPTIGTPLNSTILTGATYTDNPTTQTAYGYTVVAVYPPCSLTSSLTTACGAGGAVTLTFVPVPPQGVGATNLVIVVQ